jgi:ribonuclease H / adenosylcobalamin/alpha-ribazole phosphatase
MTTTLATVTPPVDPSAMTGSGPDHPVWLIRHAPTSWTGRRWCGRANPPLSPAGRRVAYELARTIAASPDLVAGATIRSSPARRASATARAIATVTSWPVVEDDDLLEADVGAGEGLTWPDLTTRFPDLAERLARGERVDWPGGETIEAVDHRAHRAANRVLEDAARGAVLVVSHGALLHVLAGLLASTPDVPFFPPGGMFRLAPVPR